MLTIILHTSTGHLVGQGTHEELLKDNEVYQQLALRQLSMGAGEVDGAGVVEVKE